MEFKLPYYVRDNGDGSASVEFTASEAEADNNPDAEEGWGESTSGNVHIKVENDKLYVRNFEKVNRKYEYVWVEVNQS